MARPRFKERWTKLHPEAAERSTFVLATGIIVLATMYPWQPIAGMAWSMESGALSIALRVVGGLGWSYLLLASFAIDHFELFGVKQVWRNYRSLEQPHPPFTTRWMYRFERDSSRPAHSPRAARSAEARPAVYRGTRSE